MRISLVSLALFLPALMLAEWQVKEFAAGTELRNPYGLTIGPDKALYVCDIDNHVVRRYERGSGKMTVVAGTAGVAGYSGDGGPATAAKLREPYEVRFDKAGNMYFVEMKNHLIRKVDRKTGLITTVAGNGEAGFAGDGGPAQSAQFKQPHAITFDQAGNLLICDIGNSRIRIIDRKSGQISTWNNQTFKGPRALAIAPNGTWYLALREGNAVYEINPKTGQQTLVAEKLHGPKGIAWHKGSKEFGPSLYIADTESHEVSRIDLAAKTVTPLPIAATVGPMKRPHGVYVDQQGTVYVGDSERNRVLIVRPLP